MGTAVGQVLGAAALPVEAARGASGVKGGGASDASAGQAQQQPKRRPKKRHVCEYGNYRGYYAFRLQRAGFSSDPRLGALRREWFAGRRVVDVGCNEGLVSLHVAEALGAAAVLGVDIDEDLVQRAFDHKRARMSQAQQGGEAEQRSEAGAGAGSGAGQGNTSLMWQRLDVGGVGASGGGGAAAGGAAAAPGNATMRLRAVRFRCEDFATTPADPCSADVVLALSVSKWIHMHHGDAGLKRAFAKMFDMLAPGGKLVLEPQPWKSYQQYFKLTPHIRATTSDKKLGDKLLLRPGKFQAYLTETVGFERVEVIAPESAKEESVTIGNFAVRKLLVCTKARTSVPPPTAARAMLPRALLPRVVVKAAKPKGKAT